jgi:TRAP-type mannitol/chloroaromatic compound transport system permease small subunit
MTVMDDTVAMLDADTMSAGGRPVTGRPSKLLLRVAAWTAAAMVLPFLVNNYLMFWRDWPGVSEMFSHLGWFGAESLREPLTGVATTQGWIQIALYLATLIGTVAFVTATPRRGLVQDAEIFSAVAAYIVRAAFWSVLLVGLADVTISFLRVEGLLEAIVGENINDLLGLSRRRGLYVHYPLIAVSMVIALLVRNLSFIWLTLLIVLAEFLIVITRFVFSYEQAFMGDLVRFWYSALFLFASAYTLVQEGHVRVDIIYTNFSPRGKAWTNALGSAFLGLPLCWVILTRGMWGKANIINAPLLTFEVTQSGYGLFTKYLMAGFLLVYALSMMMQFTSYVLSSAATLMGEVEPDISPSAPASPGLTSAGGAPNTMTPETNPTHQTENSDAEGPDSLPRDPKTGEILPMPF